MDYVKKITTDLIEKILSKGVRDMPQNPAAQGYDERQIRGFYYIPEKAILELIMDIESTIETVFKDINDNKVNVSDIIDNLSSEETAKPLSAKQGKMLKELITNIKQNMTALSVSLVDALPAEGETNVIYLVPNTNLEEQNIKDEYLWINGKWELIGSTAIDLTEYQKKTDDTLETESKEIVGAINEVNSKVGSSLDVQIDGTSIVENGVANIPLDNKLDKITQEDTNEYAYITKQGTQTVKRIGSAGGAVGTLAEYMNVAYGNAEPGGYLLTHTPEKDYQCANKKFVNDTVNGVKNITFASYKEMVDHFNEADRSAYSIGQNIYIRTTDVPDLWVYNRTFLSPSEFNYTYDFVITNQLKENGYITIGWYLLAPLETQKVDLAGYQPKTDNSLETESKEIVGAINEVNSKVGQGGGTSLDIQIDGTSIVQDGVANIPIWEVGGVMYSKGNGFGLVPANSTEIANRSPSRKPVTMENMDLAFRECLVNNAGTLTAEEKANAQNWLGVERLHTYALDGWLNGVCTVFITTKGKANVFLKSMWNTDQWSNPLPYISSDKEVVNMRIRLLDINVFGAIAEIHCVPFISTLTTASIDENGDVSIDDIRLDTGITQFARIHSVYGGDSTPDASDLQWVVNDFTMIFESYIYDYDTGDFKEIDKPVPFIEV